MDEPAFLREPLQAKRARLSRLGFSADELPRGPARSKRAKAGHLTEYEEQKRFVKDFRAAWPLHARALLAIENAAHRGSIARASVLKAQGMVNGASDLFLRVPRGGMHGLWIEMKTIVGKPSPDEVEFLHAAALDGYAGVVAHGSAEALRLAGWYLKEDPCLTDYLVG